MSSMLAVAAGIALLAACGSGPAPSPPAAATSAAPSSASSAAPGPSESAGTKPDHVVIVIFENKAYGQVINRAPAFDALGATGLVIADSRGVTHPSQPNYLALFSGSTQGVTDDSCPHTFSADNLGRQVIDAGLTFTGYAEGLPHSGYTGCSTGRYARKHAPWTNFADLPASVSQPYSAFPTDYTKLPSLAFVIPDMCHDMHDCSVGTGDAWLGANLSGYAAWARTHNSLLIVTFDEDDQSAGNWIPTIIVGEGVPVGHVSTRVDQYSMLRTLEHCFGLPPLGKAAAAQPIQHVCA